MLLVLQDDTYDYECICDLGFVGKDCELYQPCGATVTVL